jgi:hypothetical protein
MKVSPSQALVTWEINRIVWTSGDGSGMFDSGWLAHATGHQHVTLNFPPLIGPQTGTPLTNSGSGETTSPYNPSGAAVPTTMTLTDVASGVWDTLYTQGLENIAGTLPTATLRIGGEMYGPGWYPWCGVALGSEMQAAYQHLVTLARSINSSFTFEWNGALDLSTVNGYSLANIESLYPGNSYVDYITADVYDTLPGGNGVASWASRASELAGPLAFAQSQGKPYCLTEFGIQNYAQTGAGNNDDPAFIQAAYFWGQANQASLGWMSFFNNPPGGYGTPWDGCLQDNPQTAAIYSALFGAWAQQLAGTITAPRFYTPGFGQIGAINTVGSFTSNSGTGLKTLAVGAGTIGDMRVLAILNTGITGTVSAVAGGGCATWTKIVNANPGTPEGDAELWYGTITSASPGTITVTDSEAGTGILGCQEFSIGTPATWAVDTSAASSSTTQAASGNYPSVTPAGKLELYIGTANLPGGGIGGTTAGFTYLSGGASFQAGAQFVYSAAANNPTAQSPAWTQTLGYWAAVSALITGTPVDPTKGTHRLRVS